MIADRDVRLPYGAELRRHRRKSWPRINANQNEFTRIVRIKNHSLITADAEEEEISREKINPVENRPIPFWRLPCWRKCSLGRNGGTTRVVIGYFLFRTEILFRNSPEHLTVVFYNFPVFHRKGIADKLEHG